MTLTVKLLIVGLILSVFVSWLSCQMILNDPKERVSLILPNSISPVTKLQWMTFAAMASTILHVIAIIVWWLV